MTFSELTLLKMADLKSLSSLMSGLLQGQFYIDCFFLHVWAILPCFLHPLGYKKWVSGKLKCHKAHWSDQDATVFLEKKCFPGCFNLLITVQSSEKVDSDSFCQFLVALLEGKALGVSYSVIFTDVTPLNFKNLVYFILATLLFKSATFQVLSSYIWLIATMLDSIGL